MAKVISSVLSKCSLLQTLPKNPLSRAIHVSATSMIQVGEKIPDATLQEKDPGDSIKIVEFCQGKKVVLFGVPGAFTPFCSQRHLPGYVQHFSDIKKKGVDEIICVSVNDAFVMQAWGRANGAVGKIRMFADPNGIFTKLMGLEMDIPKLGGIRSKRYSMLLEDGKVKFLNIEPDGVGLSCSLADNLPL